MCTAEGQQQESQATPSLKVRRSTWAGVAPLFLSHLGPRLWLHWVSPPLAGPQMLCLSCCPGKGEVSPLQPSSPLGLLAASSGGPPLWWLETVQSGVVGALVVHEQTPRQPLVPCSREALERQSQRRTCGLQAVLIPCKRHPPLRWSSRPSPSAGEGNWAPALREETRMLCGCYKTAVETKILLKSGSALLMGTPPAAVS